MKNKPVLKCENLCFSYYRQPLCIKDFSIELNDDENLLILAVDGQGKTTLMRLLSGFEDKYFGKVFHFGVDVKTIEDKNKQVSLLLSDPVLVFSSIRANIDFACEVFGIEKISKEKLAKLLDEFGICRDEKCVIKKLTLFEKRLLALLRSSLKNAKFVFIDDQFCGLGEEESLKMQEVLKKFSIGKNLVFSANEETFKQNKTFFEEIKFSKIVFVSFSESYKFDSIYELENAKINFDLTKFSHETIAYEAIVFRNKDEYFFSVDKKLIFKMSKKFEKKLSCLELDNGEEEKVYLCAKTPIIFEDISNENFNKNIEKGEFSIYQVLTGEYVI